MCLVFRAQAFLHFPISNIWSSKYLFLIEIQTVRPILVKFGMNIFWWQKGSKLCLDPVPQPLESGGPKQGLGCIYSLNHGTRENFYKTKVLGQVSLSLGWLIFQPIIQIGKDLGPMYFWNHGQSFSGKVYKIIVVVHLPNCKVGQVLTPTPIPLALLRQSLLNTSCSASSQ